MVQWRDGRLEVVAGLLSRFSRGAWDAIEDDAKVMAEQKGMSRKTK